MAGYTERIDAVIQNLEDAGCGKEMVEKFVELCRTGKKQGQVRQVQKNIPVGGTAFLCGFSCSNLL